MSCLLGIEDEPLTNLEEESADFKTNKVGGKPNWASSTDHKNPECAICGKRMLLAVQIYAPLDDSANHRTLYTFCCLNAQCYCKTEGWICLRDEVQDISLLTQPISSSVPMNPTTWVDDADDWGDEDNTTKPTSLNNILTAPDINMEALTIQEMSGSTPLIPEMLIISSAEVEGMEESVTLDEELTMPTVDIRALLVPTSAPLPESSAVNFSSFFLHVTEEPPLYAKQTKLDFRVKELLDEYQLREKCDFKKMKTESDKRPSTADKEMYEKNHPSHGDQLVHKFVLRVQQTCPEQLVRYQRDSSPLLLQPLKKELPLCRHCGSSLVFEMQLMPHLSRCLTLSDFPDNMNPVDMGTVIIFTCSKSCWNQEGSEVLLLPRCEHLVVQSDMF